MDEELLKDPEVMAEAAKQLGTTEAFIIHAMTPQNVGMLPNPDGYARPQGTCGDYIELFLKVDGDVIKDARYMPEGCAHTVACGSVLTTLVKDKTLDQATLITAKDLEKVLGKLPREHRHCAALAAATLRAAIRDCLKKRQSSWKNMYQR